MGGVLALAMTAAVALSAAVPTAATAAPADHNALVIDVLGSANDFDATAVNTTYDSAGADVPVAGPSSVPGGVRVTRPTTAQTGPGLEVLPADGAPLAVGRYTDIAGQWTSGARPRPVVQLVGAGSGCSTFNVPVPNTSDWLDVKEISYASDGTVTSLAADYGMRCYDPGLTATGSVRYQSDLPYTSATSRVSYLGRVVAGAVTNVAQSITNRGTQALTLGAPSILDAPGAAASLAVAPGGDGCSQAPLAPGASCTVNLTYTADGTPGGALLRTATLSEPGLLRGYVSLRALAGGVIYPPKAPSGVTGDEAYDGVRVRWRADNDAPDGWRVYRVDGASPVLQATVPLSTQAWTDTSLAKGQTASYEVRAYNAAGETAAPPVSLTRLDLPDPPTPADRHVLVIEDDKSSARSSAASAAPAHPGYPNLITVAGGGMSLLLPRLPVTPGTYDLGTAPGQLAVGVRSPSYSCTTYGGSVSGTVDVRQAWIGADLTVSSLDADFHMDCNSLRIEAQVRLGVTRTVTSLTTTGSLQDLAATVGQAPVTKDVQLTNDGDTDVALGARNLSGPDAAAFAVTSPDCPDLLAAGSACSVRVTFTPTRSGHHTATLALALGTTLGTRSLDVAGDAVGAPAVQVPTAQPVIGRVLVSWYSGYDGGSPITGFHVLRATGGGAFEKVQDLSATTYSWVDTAVTPGSTYRYQLLTDNQYGAVTPTADQAISVTVPHEELVGAVDTGAPAVDLSSLTVGVESRPVPLGTGQDTDEPALSPDGRTLAYVVYDAGGHAGLWLRSVDGATAPRRLVDDPAADELDPTWSPDGSTVAYTRESGTAASVWTVGTAPGTTPQPLAGGSAAAGPSYLADGSAVVVTDLSSSALGLASITPAGVRTRLAGTTGGRSPAVSPRGDRIAYVSTDSHGVDQLWLVPVGGGTARSIASTYPSHYDRLAWSPDGAGLAANQFGAYGATLVTLWRDALGSEPAVAKDVRAAVGYDVYGLTWRREDVAAPVVTFPGAPTLTSGTARVPVSVVDDTTPVGGLAVACAVDGRAVARCASGFAGTLPTGAHTLTVTAADAHGHTGSASYTWTVDATAPVVTAAAVPLVVLTKAVTFAYVAKDPAGVASYDVRYRRAAWSGGAFTAFSSPAGWAGTTATSRSLSLAAGNEYCFSVRARDKLGNTAGYSAERCTSAPLDDRSMVRAGFTQISGSGYYAGTAARATTRGAALSRPSVTAARQLFVVATSCATCGTLDVYVGTTRIGSVNLASRTTVNRRVFALPVFSTRSGTVVLRVTSSGRPVIVDGLGIRR